MTNSPQSIAEALARKCADNIHSQFSDEWFNNIPSEMMLGASGAVYRDDYRIASNKRKMIARWIVQSIPLMELIELKNLAERMNEELGWHTVSSKLASIDPKLRELKVIE